MGRASSEALMPAKLAARRRAVRKERRGRIRRAALVGTTIVTLTYGGWSLAHSRLFALDGIDVRGAQRVTRQEVLRAAAVHIGMNVLSIDPGLIVRRLKALPAIRTASVERLYPSRLRILVVERRPAAVLTGPGASWLLDDEGVAMGEATSTLPGLPVIRLEETAVIVPGRPVTDAGAVDALAVWHAFPAALRARVGAIDAQAGAPLSVMVGRTRVVFGDASDLPEKIGALQAIMRGLAGQTIVRVDLTAPSRPAALAF